MRIDYPRTAPAAVSAMMELQRYIRNCGLDQKLIKLIEIRASIINGCAYCIDMHTQDARALGETEQRLYALPVWRETPFFSPRERAALAWTETVTALPRAGVPDSAFEEIRASFTESEIVDLTMVIVTINGWNRLAVSFAAEPGTYRPTASPIALQPA